MMGAPEEEWPDLLLLLGDQVYADEPSVEMLEFIRNRRDGEPAGEIADFEEYAELYRQAWTDPEIRWILSTVPSAMIFDDHDLRDDFNTSATWREQMAKVPWWPRRVVSGLGAYWIYQHLGNMSPQERASDELLSKLCAAEGDGSEMLDTFAEHAYDVPADNRWSYSRDLGGTRLIMLDSRCARQLAPGDRRMIDPVEWEWLTEELRRGGVERFVIGTSVPFLLPAGIHHIQNWNEALAQGPGASGWPAGPRRSARPSTWSTGRPSAGRSRICRTCWPGPASPWSYSPATCTTPTSPRPRGCPSTSSSAPRSATR